MVDMVNRPESKIWGLASASEVEALLRGLGLTMTAQDADLKYTASVNAPFLYDGTEIIGLSDEDLFTVDLNRNLQTSKQRVTVSGRGESIDVSRRFDDRTVWHRVWVEPLPATSEARGLLCASVDITQQKEAEEHLRLALLELAHRSKNLLAVVLSIARQSAEESETLAQFGSRFVGRIRALAIAHDVLTDESWRGATIFSLVRSQLSAFSETASRQSTIEGHNAYLKPNAVQYVGLALHELLAQSVLEGALSSPEGRIDFSSSIASAESGDGSDLLLMWRETNMPEKGQSENKSEFGATLLERIVPASLNGRARLDRAVPGTLHYELRIPGSQFF
jgi:two-component sensor histidine kinase